MDEHHPHLFPARMAWLLALARMVGASGQVVAVDLQEPVLRGLRRRARRARVAERVHPRVACEAWPWPPSPRWEPP